MEHNIGLVLMIETLKVISNGLMDSQFFTNHGNKENQMEEKIKIAYPLELTALIGRINLVQSNFNTSVSDLNRPMSTWSTKKNKDGTLLEQNVLHGVVT